ncbi:LuxR C-terminal-related transcriptional regulator [Actinomadura sp. 21ATH]|uniref:ATP-binding protein n=1 Tax=Actinomadura sp. 21ATH TaxID=1735444 RepID=UPI0035C05DF7
MLYGREEEQARIARLIADARDHRRSHAAVIRGETGIGKSTLLEWAAGQAAAAGDGRLLRATGFEAEATIAFAGLNQLLWPVRDRLDALPGPQAAVLRGALGLDVPAAGGADRFLAGLAVLTLLADLAEDGPLLCLVDDAQWLDTATAEALLFAARRLAAEGVVMLFAARDEGFDGGGLEELRPRRLGHRDAVRLLRDHDGVPALLREQIVKESAGNPLALIELGAAWNGHGPATAPLPLADRVTAAFREQIERLPERTRLVMLIAAAEGRGHLPSTLGAARALGADLADLEPAERAGLMEVAPPAYRFRHPLISAAVYQGATAARRLEVHRALADTSTDLDCTVRHRASAAVAPDESVAADLEASAERARDRTGYCIAARLYQQAAELTPERVDRARRLATAAAAMLQAGETRGAEDLAAAAERITDDPAGHAVLARLRATVEFERGDPRAAARMLADQAERMDGADREALLRTAAAYAWMAGESPVLCRAAGLLPAADRAVQGMARLIEGDYGRGLPLLADLAAEPPGRTGDRIEAVQAVLAALIVGADAAALDLATAEAAHCRRQGLIGALPNVLQLLAQAQIAAGLHQDARATVAEATGLARDTGFERRAERLADVLSRIAAIEGDGRSVAAADGGSLGLLDLGQGRYDDAVRRLEEVVRGPHRHTADVMISAADLVEAAVRAGSGERAQEAYETFAAWAEAGRQPWALAVASRSQALLNDAEKPFTDALALHDRTGRPFEKARTELLYGEWLRRARRRSDARVPLRSALEAFERLRAEPWADRARAELRATGDAADHAEAAAPDLLDRLTPQERQVVRLAAGGNSSREIAAQLFLSPRTVEYHLYKAYPKLGVSSRKELTRLRASLEPAATG